MATRPLGRTETVLARLLNKRLRTVVPPLDLTPLQVAVIYAFFGFAALYFSDVYLPQIIRNPVVLKQVQALKGGIEVALTAGLILLLTHRSRQALDQQNQQLNALQAERSILYRVFRHNLRQDINVAIGKAERIESNTEDELVSEACEELIGQMVKIGQYQNYMTQIERILETPVSLEKIDLSAMVLESTLLGDLKKSEEISVSLDLPEEMYVFASEQIDQAFHEILENAVEHSDANNPAIRISIAEGSGDLIDLSVTDNGSGIPEYEREAINQMEEEQLSHSSGLGLWQAKLACSVSGGELLIPPQEGDEGKVVLRLPAVRHHQIQRRISERLRLSSP